jgi:hypothetical protein
MNDKNQSSPDPHVVKKLESFGWGAFIIWVGLSILFSFNFNFTLLGIGLITLAVQVLRRNNNLPTEGFWVIAGFLFLFGAVWGMLNIVFPLIPIIIIIAGIVIISQALKKKE